MKKINVESSINRYYAIIAVLSIIGLIILLVVSIQDNSKQFLVQSGLMERTEIATGYIVKKENIIIKDQTKVILPIISEGARVSKGDIIATYKGEEYRNYEQTLSEMDREILQRMQELPMVYSSEVDAIDATIYTLIKESIGETSYNKMQEYKQKINSNINKRANIIGQLSPHGAEIKQLIDRRNDYEAKAKQSNDNVLATIPGIVSYTVDSLEEKIKYDSVETLDYTHINMLVTEQKQIDNTKIKIVDNYQAYIVMKVSLENSEFIEEGYNYRLRLIEQDSYEFLGNLKKVIKKQDGVEVYFEVTNGIEKLVNLREAEIEVVWDYEQGLIVPSETLNKYDNKEQYYIIAIKNSEYEEIPFNVKLKNGDYMVVNNYTEEELESLNISSKFKLELYDRIIMDNKNRR